jgi:arylsulfatase A
MRELTNQTSVDRGGEDSFSLMPAFKGNSNGRKNLISHSIGGSFSIREGDWKLCLAAGSGGWSAPREPDAKKQGLPPMQLFNLKTDRGERQNLVQQEPERASALIKLLNEQVIQGRCTPGKAVSNDREVSFLPKGVALSGPSGKTK